MPSTAGGGNRRGSRPADWPAAAWRRRGLERFAQAIADRSLQRWSIAGDTQVASTGDNAVIRRKEISRERERIPNSHIELEMELAGERQKEQGGVWDAAGYTPSFDVHVLNREVRE